ncbi:MAG: tetratricopeptide repeat protein [Acidobacteria bacterium]|nr:MAG: tetratricopeptide repeat protein [Acidobacteriota bacterium]
MTSAPPIRAIAVVLATLWGSLVEAEVVLFLTNGGSITVERYWEEGNQILYEKNGSTFGFPQHLLERVHERSGETAKTDPADEAEAPTSRFLNALINEDVDRARQSVAEGDLESAAELFGKAVSKAPDDLEVRMELARVHFERGDLRAARSVLEQANRRRHDNAHDKAKMRELLGDVYAGLGRSALAIREWQLALNIEPSPELLYKLKQALRENDQDIDFEEVRRPHYVIRYDGHINETIGHLVATSLDSEYAALRQEFRFEPTDPIEVTLYTNREFRDVTHAPAWASALNDGEIRIPVEGLTEITPRLRRAIRHELTHSFINAMTRGNCPSWFHEGLAQLRGSDRMDPYPTLRVAQAEGNLLPLWSLEGLFVNYSKEKARLVYAEALAATEYLELRRGRESLRKILMILGSSHTMNEALKAVVGLDYQEFQTAWEADLKRFHPSTH